MNYLNIISKYIGKEEFDYKHISYGWDFDVFFVDGLVFRFSKEGKIYNKLLYEKKLLELVSNYVNFQVPVYEHIGEDFVVYKLIEGNTLSEIKFNYDEKNIKLISDFLKQLHGIPVEEVNYLLEDKGKKESDEFDLNSFVESFKLEIEKNIFHLVDKNVIKNIFNYMDELFFHFKGSEEKLVHGDFQPKNIIEKNGFISGVIDFSEARIGAIEDDFGHFLLLDEDLGKKMITEYLGFWNKNFMDNAFFLARRHFLFEIKELNSIEDNKRKQILSNLKKLKFL